MSQLQCMRVWRACTRSLPSTLPTIIRSIPGKQPAHLPKDSAAVRIVSSPCGPTVPSKTRRAPKYRARPFVIMRGPPLGSLLHLKICSVAIETNVSFTLVPETNAYMPSNCVVAVGGDGDCAAATAEKPQIPPIHSQPTLFRTCIPSRPNSRLDRASPGHPRLSAPETRPAYAVQARTKRRQMVFWEPNTRFYQGIDLSQFLLGSKARLVRNCKSPSRKR